MNHPSSSTALRTVLLPADEAGIAEAGERLRTGGLIGLPTETVYGLAADATSGEAVARIYAAKERPQFNPLIAHLPSAELALAEGVFDEAASALANAFWPGPLTLVVPTAPGCRVSDLARAGLPTLGLRVPSHPIARAVLAAADRPIAAPSANRSGRISPTSADDVLVELGGRIDAIVDAGPCEVGLESTIVACLGGPPRLLRPGGVSREAIESVLGFALTGAAEDGALIAPGMLASHYAPRARLRLGATAPEAQEAWLGFGPEPSGMLPAMRENLSPRGDLAEAAAALFGALRRLDAQGAGVIAVAPIPRTGLGEAINDRLARAAAPR